MGKMLSVGEVSRLTGLAAHTLRFYEKQFPKTLAVQRTTGGHRQYGPVQLAGLQKVLDLVKEDRLSIREARLRLGEEAMPVSVSPSAAEIAPALSREPVGAALQEVLAKLNKVCDQNSRIDRLLEALVCEKSEAHRRELLDQIARCRQETRDSVRLYEALRGRQDPAGVQPNAPVEG